MAGGVALNCVANGKILKSGLFKDMWIQPAAGDAGGALGAAYAAHCIERDQPIKQKNGDGDLMKGSYLGPQFHEQDITRLKRKFNADSKPFSEFNKLCDTVVDLLVDGKVVGWFQGRMEGDESTRKPQYNRRCKTPRNAKETESEN